LSRELVERAMHGDQDAFGILAERSLPRLVGTAGLILRDADAADDAAQEALVRAWRDLPGLRDPDRFDAWLHRVLVRACGDQARRRRRDRRDETAIAPPQPTADAAQRLADRDEMERGLERLSLEQRTAVVLHYYLGLSHSEIAEATGQPLGTVKSRLSRALDALQAALAADARIGSRREGPA
jgi:RNA polymerase sigma-70 factor (ECF subfamily)